MRSQRHKMKYLSAPLFEHQTLTASQTPHIFSIHFAYPFPIADLSTLILSSLKYIPAQPGRTINNQPNLDLIYYEPFVPRLLARQLFEHLRSTLPFYKVSYTIQRGPVPTNIVTPRFTTVFGLDTTSRFNEAGQTVSAYPPYQLRGEKEYTSIPPRPIPQSLDALRKITEEVTGCNYNFVLVNFYTSGVDSIAYHSDDERFLGANPTIASLSLGARRDFLLKHKPMPNTKPPQQPAGTEVLKLPLGSGDMVLMRGKTQAQWLHSVPKRGGSAKEDGGRVNITFRKAMGKGGTANYYQYNVGGGSVYRWSEGKRRMEIWENKERSEVRYHRGPREEVLTRDEEEVRERVRMEWKEEERLGGMVEEMVNGKGEDLDVMSEQMEVAGDLDVGKRAVPSADELAVLGEDDAATENSIKSEEPNASEAT